MAECDIGRFVCRVLSRLDGGAGGEAVRGQSAGEAATRRGGMNETFGCFCRQLGSLILLSICSSLV